MSSYLRSISCSYHKAIIRRPLQKTAIFCVSLKLTHLLDATDLIPAVSFYLVTTQLHQTYKRPLHAATSCLSKGIMPKVMLLLQNGKVRDVKYLEREQRVASLAINGTVQISDAHLNKISLVDFPCSHDSDSLETLLLQVLKHY